MVLGPPNHRSQGKQTNMTTRTVNEVIVQGNLLEHVAEQVMLFGQRIHALLLDLGEPPPVLMLHGETSAKAALILTPHSTCEALLTSRILLWDKILEML